MKFPVSTLGERFRDISGGGTCQAFSHEKTRNQTNNVSIVTRYQHHVAMPTKGLGWRVLSFRWWTESGVRFDVVGVCCIWSVCGCVYMCICLDVWVCAVFYGFCIWNVCVLWGLCVWVVSLFVSEWVFVWVFVCVYGSSMRPNRCWLLNSRYWQRRELYCFVVPL